MLQRTKSKANLNNSIASPRPNRVIQRTKSPPPLSLPSFASSPTSTTPAASPIASSPLQPTNSSARPPLPNFVLSPLAPILQRVTTIPPTQSHPILTMSPLEAIPLLRAYFIKHGFIPAPYKEDPTKMKRLIKKSPFDSPIEQSDYKPLTINAECHLKVGDFVRFDNKNLYYIGAGYNDTTHCLYLWNPINGQITYAAFSKDIELIERFPNIFIE